MELNQIVSFLGWCAVINYGVLVVWWLIFVFAHSWLYTLNNEWFNISEEEFDKIHYTCIGLYKLAMLLFFLIPYLVLKFLV